MITLDDTIAPFGLLRSNECNMNWITKLVYDSVERGVNADTLYLGHASYVSLMKSVESNSIFFERVKDSLTGHRRLLGLKIEINGNLGDFWHVGNEDTFRSFEWTIINSQFENILWEKTDE